MQSEVDNQYWEMMTNFPELLMERSCYALLSYDGLVPIHGIWNSLCLDNLFSCCLPGLQGCREKKHEWASMGFTDLDTLDRYTVSDTVSDLARFWTPHCCREQRVGKNHDIGNFRREICQRRVDPRDLPADEGRS